MEQGAERRAIVGGSATAAVGTWAGMVERSIQISRLRSGEGVADCGWAAWVTSSRWHELALRGAPWAAGRARRAGGCGVAAGVLPGPPAAGPRDTPRVSPAPPPANPARPRHPPPRPAPPHR